VISEKKKQYFACVLIGVKYETGEPLWGPISFEQAERETTRMFHCESCSTPDHRVYHNILGVHAHLSEERLLGLIKSAPFEE